MLKKMISLMLFAALLGVGLSTLLPGHSSTAPPESFWELGSWADRVLKSRLSSYETLSQLAPSLLLLGGAKEQDGIFITRDYLLENITSGTDNPSDQNLAAIDTFLEDHNIPAIVMLIPTACAIKQQETPALAQLYNQKSLIASVYDHLSGKATTVDVYTELFAARDQYTYYRTASNLTGLGGYYVYAALVGRRGLVPRSLSQFEVEHLPQDYYGDLYSRSSYKSIRPDIITLYRFTRSTPQYQVMHTGEDGFLKSYYTLFPRHWAALGHPENVVLGGFSPRMDLFSSLADSDSLLIFADDTVLSYLPFLMIHFGRVTVIDLERYAPESLKLLDMEEYDQVMFAYSVGNFIDRPITRALSNII
ncbi:MAG: DHHW family protein [Oscillospiraceae bacterium]